MTYLAKAVHALVVADPDDAVALRGRDLGGKASSGGIVLSSMRDDGGRAALDDMNGYLERARQCLDLGGG